MLNRSFHLLAELLSQIPRRLVLSASSVLAGLLYLIYRCSPYRNFIAQNVQAALPERNVNQLVRQHIKLLLWSICDLLRFKRLKKKKQIPSEVQIEGWQYMQKAHAKNKGVILVSAHYGCWEWIPAVVSLKGLPMSVIVQKPSLDSFDQLFREFRAYAGVKTINNDSLMGVRPLIKTLKAGDCVGMVIDQHGESNHVFGQFFGHQVSMPEGPAYLASRYQIPLIPVLIRWQGDKHLIEFFPELDIREIAANYPAESLQTAIMQTIYSWLESQIRLYPENWLWSYNRWDKLPGQRCESQNRAQR